VVDDVQATGEVLIHIADVQSLFSSFPALDRLARQRGESLYLADGILQLLPPYALLAVALSDKGVNECVTLAVKVGDDGSISGARFFQSLIGPVERVRYEEVNDLVQVRSPTIHVSDHAGR
jgi:ribonuclease R